MISRKFPASHPRKGQFTGFMQAIYEGEKIHTIRANYPLWENRIKQIQEGKAILSIRTWEEVPYRSRQMERIRLDSRASIGIQELEFVDAKITSPSVGGQGYIARYPLHTLAKNDYLSMQDFKDWFKGYDKSKPMAIIHFTNFRY